MNTEQTFCIVSSDSSLSNCLQDNEQISTGNLGFIEPNKTFMKKFYGTTKKTIQQAEECLTKLDHVTRQVLNNVQRK